jgi:hypothetical protein
MKIKPNIYDPYFVPGISPNDIIEKNNTDRNLFHNPISRLQAINRKISEVSRKIHNDLNIISNPRSTPDEITFAINNINISNQQYHVLLIEFDKELNSVQKSGYRTVSS